MRQRVDSNKVQMDVKYLICKDVFNSYESELSIDLLKVMEETGQLNRGAIAGDRQLSLATFDILVHFPW